MSIKIVTDSTSYIPSELLREYDIKVVSLNVVMNGKSYREVDLKNEDFYIEMDKLDEIPTSSQPSLEEVRETFMKIAAEGNDIVGVFISSNMSGTYSSAHIVKDMVLEEYPNINIEIIDSKSNCMQMGFEVLQGARAAKEGKNMEEVIETIKYTINNSRFLFIPDTLKYLKKGGRIGGAAALFGTLLQIKPILTVEYGTTSVFNKVRTRKKAIEVMIDKVVEDIGENKGEVIVHHINCKEDGEKLAKQLEEKLNVKVLVDSIGPIIGLHVGPGSIGIAYHYTK